jgi:hypothetical protein
MKISYSKLFGCSSEIQFATYIDLEEYLTYFVSSSFFAEGLIEIGKLNKVITKNPAEWKMSGPLSFALLYKTSMNPFLFLSLLFIYYGLLWSRKYHVFKKEKIRKKNDQKNDDPWNVSNFRCC